MDDGTDSAPVAGPRDELNARIDQLDRLVGRPSGREMARLAGLSGAELPSSTLSDIRKRRRIPRADSLDAFVKACLCKAQELSVEVPPPLDDLEGWQRLREAAVRTTSEESVQTQSSTTGKPKAVNRASLASRNVPLAGEIVRKLPVDTGLFVGRMEEMARLENATVASKRIAVVAVHGLGGVGKSALVARFAELHAERFSPVWWLTADSTAAIDAGLADLATALDPETAELTTEQRTAQAVAWLASHDGWLLVLDNVTTPADADGMLERVRTGTILITSRQGTGWRGLASLSLDVLSQSDALELFERIVRTDWADADLTDGALLCAELGWLPLALEQAGAYIAQTCITVARYLDLLARFPARMFTATAEGGDAQRTMARVWRVTLDRLADTPLAGSVLRRLAWHAPDNIPRSMLDGPDEVELSEALGRLAAYSMINLDVDTINVHRLVQAVTRTPDPTDPHRRPEDITYARDTTAKSLAQALAEADPYLPANWPLYRVVLPHARALLNHTSPDTDPLCALADYVGRYVRGQGDAATAIALAIRALHSRERLQGSNHPETRAARNDLASAYFSAGDLGHAIPLWERVLADVQRVLGRHHPDALGARNNLASAYQELGDLERAIPLYEATLADAQRILGHHHQNTLGAQNNLARAYEAAGDLERAIPLHEATITDYKRVLGSDHPDTLTACNNLARDYEIAGDLTRAIALFEDTLNTANNVLGFEHPTTLKLQNNLAHAYGTVGDLDRAISMYEATLNDRERVLGADHPNTLITRGNLARAYEAVGDLDRAIQLLEKMAADKERLLGADHADTMTSRIDLADVYKTAGDLSRAISLYEATFADAERLLGSDHSITLAFRNDLAGGYLSVGDLDRTIPLLERNLADRERLQGSEHPDVLTSRMNLASAYETAGDLARAIPLYEASVTDAERLLGPDHLVTRMIRSKIARPEHD